MSYVTRTESETLTSLQNKKGILPLLVLVLSTTSALSAQADTEASCPVQPSSIRFESSQTSPFAESFRSGFSKVLRGHIPHAVKGMADVGKINQDQTISVTIALQLNNETELDNRISELYRSGSPTYHQFLTSDEFRARYSPTEEQVANEKARLEAQGIAVQSVSGNRVFLKAQGSVAALNQMFATELHQFKNTDGKAYFAPAYELQAPAESQITAVVGLNNVTKFHNHLKAVKAAASEGNAPGGGLAPADITTAYGVPNSVDGSGQTLALFELDGYDPSDIAAYDQQFNLPNTPLENVLVDGATGDAGEGATEVVLDIEMMAAVAPNVSNILVYEGPNSSEGLVDTYAKIADDNRAQQISSSWGEAEESAAASDMQSENTIFKQMVAQGQALYSAAGDSGAEDNGSQLSVDDPSGQPNVIAVGGTTLKISSNSAYSSETTWNDLSSGHGAGGGGVSTVWTIPSYQKSVVSSDKQASTTMRNVPDVSLNADPETGYGIYQGGQWMIVGGTSAAAPLWAAFNALVNQKRLASGLSPLGFPAPALYSIGKGSSYSSSFNDIIKGTNGTGSNSFTAVKGYDNATGLGSFKAEGLLDQLSQN